MPESDTENDLANLTFENIAEAIYRKRGYIPDSTPLNKIINPQSLSNVKKKLGIKKA